MQSWVTTFLLRWRWNILTMAQKALLLCCIFSSWKHVTFSSVAVLSGISCFLELYLFLDQVIISEVCHILIVTYVCRKMWRRVGIFFFSFKWFPEQVCWPLERIHSQTVSVVALTAWAYVEKKSSDYLQDTSIGQQGSAKGLKILRNLSGDWNYRSNAWFSSVLLCWSQNAWGPQTQQLFCLSQYRFCIYFFLVL